MRRLAVTLITLTGILIGACHPIVITQASIPHPTPIATGAEFCGSADTHLQQLGCIPADKPYTLRGLTFTQFCQQTLANGVALNPQCLSTVPTCTNWGSVCENPQ